MRSAAFYVEWTVNSGIIANTNTVFNLICAACLFPMLGVYERFSRRLVRDKPQPEEKYKAQPDALNPVFFDTRSLSAIAAGRETSTRRLRRAGPLPIRSDQ